MLNVLPRLENEFYNFVFSSPQQSLASKKSSSVMIVMTTSSTSLEEQVALLAKSVESLVVITKEKDEQIAFVMEKSHNAKWKRIRYFKPKPTHKSSRICLKFDQQGCKRFATRSQRSCKRSVIKSQ